MSLRSSTPARGRPLRSEHPAGCACVCGFRPGAPSLWASSVTRHAYSVQVLLPSMSEHPESSGPEWRPGLDPCAQMQKGPGESKQWDCSAPPPGGGVPKATPTVGRPKGGASRAGQAVGLLLLRLCRASGWRCVEATCKPLPSQRIRMARWGSKGAGPGCWAAQAPRRSQSPELRCRTVGDHTGCHPWVLKHALVRGQHCTVWLPNGQLLPQMDRPLPPGEPYVQLLCLILLSVGIYVGVWDLSSVVLGLAFTWAA